MKVEKWIMIKDKRKEKENVRYIYGKKWKRERIWNLLSEIFIHVRLVFQLHLLFVCQMYHCIPCVCACEGNFWNGKIQASTNETKWKTWEKKKKPFAKELADVWILSLLFQWYKDNESPKMYNVCRDKDIIQFYLQLNEKTLPAHNKLFIQLHLLQMAGIKTYCWMKVVLETKKLHHTFFNYESYLNA